MGPETVREIVREEVSKSLPFRNLHGITRESLNSYLAKDFAVRVNPDGRETNPREMRIAAQERAGPEDGYVVVYDPLEGGWGVAEHESDGRHILVIGAESLDAAPDGMCRTRHDEEPSNTILQLTNRFLTGARATVPDEPSV